MSQANVEIVQTLFEATARRDAEAARPLLDPDVEWDMSTFPFPDLAGAYRGHDEVFAWWLRYFDAWDECGFEILDVLHDEANELVVATRAWGRGRDGIAVDRSFANLMTLRNGKLIRNQAFQDQAKALEAAGLRE
jgi:ketosteroid isomerase-like protein